MEIKRVAVFGYPNTGEHFIKLMYYICNGSTEEIECERAFRYYPKGDHILTFVNLQRNHSTKRKILVGLL